MRTDLRNRIPGGCYFFTVVLARRTERHLVEHINALRTAVLKVRASHPFLINAFVVLPEHLHCMWTLPTVIPIFQFAGT